MTSRLTKRSAEKFQDVTIRISESLMRSVTIVSLAWKRGNKGNVPVNTTTSLFALSSYHLQANSHFDFAF